MPKREKLERRIETMVNLKKINKALNELNTILKPFMPFKQAEILKYYMAHSEEREAFADIILGLAERVKAMPKVYETDGQGNKAIAQLHYFGGSYDAYIVEKDTSDEQYEVFGYASFGYGFEAGYISIDELLGSGVELDLHFDPKSIGEVIGE